jgi:hypothetical protein
MKSLAGLVEKHSAIFNEDTEEVKADYVALERDEKPAVLTELAYDPALLSYEEFIQRVKDFVTSLYEAGYWTFFAKERMQPDFEDLCVSKIRSVAHTLALIDTIPTDYEAGAVGLLLGYPYREVLSYVKKNVADVELIPRFGTQQRTRKRRHRKVSPNRASEK